MKSCLKIEGNRGFAIVEVLVSLAIIAIIIVTFEALIVRSAKISRANQSEFQANLYLRETIEIAKALEQSITDSAQWDTVFPLNTCDGSSKCSFVDNVNSWSVQSSAEPKLDGVYNRNFDIIQPDPLNADIKKITATISWNNGMRDRTLTLETYVYRIYQEITP